MLFKNPSAFPDQDKLSATLLGLIAGAGSFTIWGASPIYWKLLTGVPAFEILMHRIVWSLVFLTPIVWFLAREEFRSLLKNRYGLMMLTGSTVMVGANWLIYIWAVTHNQVLQASLGYFICPLVNVLLGTVFLKERLRRNQLVAVILAASAVFYLTLQFGQIPWVALSLAGSFGLYGLIRKTVVVGALVGLAMECLLLIVPAVGYLLFLDINGSGTFWRGGWSLSVILIGTFLPTAPPLLLFTFGARRLNLSTMGFLQYIMPTCAFLLAVFLYHEPFERVQLATFVMIWLALAIFSIDSIVYQQRHMNKRN